MPAETSDGGPLADLERRIRERAVRVEERLALLQLLAQPDAEQQLAERRRALVQAARDAAARLKAELG